ncbi:TonB-dependent receptor [Sphingomonas sp. DG1-23]|uniref:TonB-dependent receptor domain-containing protein n=1 Tax=Sphingomonas sp. DG1-23 TaxID=3068316 RepID=UPI00273E091D|nr:TonB-dependent receptor [Sphingomonas sp. DG1-23]MDP5280835.1 TonB-dependent receptor [Sphingomonas sp. DG1-23]
MGAIAPKLRHILLVGVANLGLVASVAAAQAAPRETSFKIEAQPLATALRDLAIQSGVSILADSTLTQGKMAARYAATSDVEVALGTLLRGSGLTYRQRGNLYVVVAARATTVGAGQEQPAPQTVDNESEIVVTAQKIEESIQDVPIAVSAFSGAALDNLKIETGGELLRAIPNVTFSKSNFSGYNFSIRGVGTKAVSASTDPAVAVSFNNTPLIRNRLFEQEFLDLQRVEVLRGPQGTLYGRNATGGVVNVLPALPSNKFSAEIEAEVGNFETRRVSGMVNLPLSATLAVRAAAAWTKREGFEYNSFNDTKVNGRDLWTGRVSALWEPSDGFRASVIWQHFEEDDNRSRSGKQLCTRDPGPTQIGSTPVPDALRARFSQGCQSRTLFSDEAFGVPNAESFPHVFLASNIGLGDAADFTPVFAVPQLTDPFEGVTQSRNLREISTSYDPVFRAKNDFYQLNLDVGLGGGLTLISQTAFARDRYYSSQDYSRFASNPIFGDSTQAGLTGGGLGFAVVAPGLTPGGIFTDPQLGASDRFLSVDLSKSSNEQWTQELRLQSAWDGPLNINLGGNYLNFKSKDDYYVFSNLFTLSAQYFYNLDVNDQYDFDNSLYYIRTRACQPTGPGDAAADCIYVDPNPLDKINGDGHNYFRSKNEVQTESWALFGELYYKLTDRLKVTGGLRYTNDTKTSTPYPSQLLLGIGTVLTGSTGGKVAIGYPPQPDIVQKWQRFSGRAVIDWKPDLGFTEETLIYGSFSHGYKGGGSNPPRVDFDPEIVRYQPLAQTFAPEYVNAFEIGTKNIFANGRAGLNLTGFYYDYTNYQVSQIVDRISLNENLDSTSMGIEAEAWWQPSRNFRLDANLGYLRTRIADGEQSIDVMDRTQGNPDWVVVRPWVQVPSNCVAPRVAVEAILSSPLSQAPDGGLGTYALAALCSASSRLGDFDPNLPEGQNPFYALYGFLYDPLLPYDPTRAPIQPFGSTDPRSGAPNGGRGFYADLGGNELPNSPRLTLNVGAQYSLFLDEWKLTLRGDYYRQGPSYARVYNTAYDRLRGWDNANLAFTLENAKWDMTAQFYVKNVFNGTPITDAFTNSDDTGLTTNVFTLEPRIFGFRLAKRF